jgi:hypothetical protein
MNNYITMTEIRARYASLNPTGHWFDKDTIKFFSCTLAEGGRITPGGEILFATSEKPPHGRRAYSVRVLRADGDIDTVGEFCGFGSWAAAERAIAEMVSVGEEAAAPAAGP